MITPARTAAPSDVRFSGNVLRSARLLVRRLEAIAAQHDGHDDVIAVCQKWAHRVSVLEREAIEAGIDDVRPDERH